MEAFFAVGFSKALYVMCLLVLVCVLFKNYRHSVVPYSINKHKISTIRMVMIITSTYQPKSALG